MGYLPWASIVRIYGRSMTPTLHPGEWIWAKHPHSLRRGDIVLIDKTDRYIKRIVGLPGEYVECGKGRVRINYRDLTEPYIMPNASLQPMADHQWRLEPESFYVLGDARDDSADSRRFGPVAREEIKGVLTHRLWPLQTVGKLAAIVLALSLFSHAAAAAGAFVLAKENRLVASIGKFVEGRGWIQDADFYITSSPGDIYTLYGPHGILEEVKLEGQSATLPGTVPAQWNGWIKRRIKEPLFALAIQGAHPVLPPGDVRDRALTDPEALKILADYLKSKGLKAATPVLTQVLEFDLDGQAPADLLLCAQSINTHVSTVDAADMYSVSLLRVNSATHAKTLPLASQTTHKPQKRSLEEHWGTHGKPIPMRILTILDLNGDGKKEMVLYQGLDSADSVEVFEYQKDRLRKALASYKPLGLG